MLKACSRCGRVHGHGECTAGGYVRYTPPKDTPVRRFRRTGRWQRKRNSIVKRDGYLCRLCLDNMKLTSDNLQVHHIIPVAVDDSLKLVDDNLITLCPDCHRQVEGNKKMIGYLQRLAKSPLG